jgi:hypothetical protein
VLAGLIAATPHAQVSRMLIRLSNRHRSDTAGALCGMRYVGSEIFYKDCIRFMNQQRASIAAL